MVVMVVMVGVKGSQAEGERRGQRARNGVRRIRTNKMIAAVVPRSPVQDGDGGIEAATAVTATVTATATAVVGVTELIKMFKMFKLITTTTALAALLPHVTAAAEAPTSPTSNQPSGIVPSTAANTELAIQTKAPHEALLRVSTPMGERKNRTTATTVAVINAPCRHRVNEPTQFRYLVRLDSLHLELHHLYKVELWSQVVVLEVEDVLEMMRMMG
jgi:hypothetical protein